MSFFRELFEYHQQVKHKIHTTKLPLGIGGQRVMGMIYLLTPVFVGYGFMQMVVAKSDTRWGVDVKSGRDIFEERRRNKAIQRGEDPSQTE